MNTSGLLPNRKTLNLPLEKILGDMYSKVVQNIIDGIQKHVDRELRYLSHSFHNRLVLKTINGMGRIN